MKQNQHLIRLFLALMTVSLVLNKHQVLSACSEGFADSGGTCDECGVTYVSPNVKRSILLNGTLDEKLLKSDEDKIVGGVTAAADSWPAQALVYISGSGGTFMCGGTLIKRNVVLTAAHCTALSSSPTSYQVYLGVQDKQTLSGSGIVKASVKTVVQHSSYNRNNMQNDIALLILTASVSPSSQIQIACLPKAQSSSYPSSGMASWAVGWGTTSFQGSTSRYLNNVKLTVYTGSTSCSRYSNTNWNTQVCSGETAGGKDTCQGDSGGPLYIYDTIGGKSKYIQVGITSYGNGCGSAGFPGVYTRTSAYLDWIKANEAKKIHSVTSSITLFLLINLLISYFAF